MAQFQKSDHQIIRDYITANDHLQYTQLPEGVVAILMTHSNLATKHVDLRLSLHSTIADVKEKFRTHIGTPPEYQQLILKDEGNVLCELADNNRKLGFYSVLSGMEIHVIDHDPFSLSRNGGLTDVSLVQKYTISEEAYDKRKGTMRDFIRQQREKDPNYKIKAKQPASSEPVNPPPGEESVTGMKVGDRCEVQPGARRGTVKFIGEISQISAGGFWVGVQFDEPVGHNDGFIKGSKIFECPAGFGAFIRGHNIKVGDFPVRDIFDSDNEETNGAVHANEVDEDEM